jgi:hypothetical protein
VCVCAVILPSFADGACVRGFSNITDMHHIKAVPIVVVVVLHYIIFAFESRWWGQGERELVFTLGKKDADLETINTESLAMELSRLLGGWGWE